MSGLFKAKRTDNGEWVEGNLVLSEDADEEYRAIIIPNAKSNMFISSNEEDLGFENWYLVDPSTICQRWKKEAQKQAAAAGKMRIALEMRLEAIEILRKINLNLLSESDDNLQRAILEQNRIQYEEQKSWLEALLQENIRDAAAGQYAEDGGDQPVLMPAT